MKNFIGLSVVAILMTMILDSSTATPIRSDAERIAQGLTGVLDGVRNGNLENVLRGSFDFTNNEHTRGVANGVINSVFNRDRTSSSGSGSGSGDLSSAVGSAQQLKQVADAIDRLA